MVSLMRSRRSSPTLTGLLAGLAPFFLARVSSSLSGSTSRLRARRLRDLLDAPRGSARLGVFSGATRRPFGLRRLAAERASHLGLAARLRRAPCGRRLRRQVLALGLWLRRLQASSARARAPPPRRVPCAASSARRRASSSSVDRPPAAACTSASSRLGLPRASASSASAPGAGDRALLLLLDHHRLRSAMAEALPHVAGLRPSASSSTACARSPRSVLSVVSFVSLMHVLCSISDCRRRHRPGPRLAGSA